MKKIHVRIMNILTKDYEDLDLVPIQDEPYEDVFTFIKAEQKYNKTMLHVLVDEGYCYTNYYYPVDKFIITRVERWSDEE